MYEDRLGEIIQSISSLSVCLCVCLFGRRVDPSDVQLRHALANLIALAFSLPHRSTHLWYFLFGQSELEGTFLPGFMVRSSFEHSGSVAMVMIFVAMVMYVAVVLCYFVALEIILIFCLS